jgi:hypothetical protein
MIKNYITRGKRDHDSRRRMYLKIPQLKVDISYV